MDLAKKLQLRANQRLEAVLVPPALTPTFKALTMPRVSDVDDALLIFVTNREVLETQRASIVASARDDHLTWVAYPKAGQLNTDLNRDSLAATLTDSGLQPVRQIALDEVWSALRFRPGS